MPGFRSRPSPPRSLAIPLLLATALAVALRTYGLTGQVLLDDEWHAIHKLQWSGWLGIVSTFGMADHSIPLTLLYKAMANTFGLAEARMRVPQVICGVALVPLAGWLAWRAVRDAPAAALFAFSIAGAPFLVMWSRFARPYAMTPLLALIAIACIWAWRTRRTTRLMAGAAVSSALLAWFHPLAGLFPAIACLFVFFEDVAAPANVRPRPSWQSIRLGAVVAGSMLVLLAPALIHDSASLRGKAGGDQPTLTTFRWLLDIYWGGLPEPAMWATCALALWGVAVLLRRDPRLALYLAALTVVPAVVLTLLGALWVQSGQNFGRYILPTQLAWLFFASTGALSVVRLGARFASTAWRERIAWVGASALVVFYLATTPAIEQVTTAGTWYAHLDYHWNYRYRNIVAKRSDPSFTRPRFYRDVLEKAPPGTIPVIEAPYIWEAPYNNLAFYASYHNQPETFGMLHDLCKQGLRIGEVPPWDRRFRFSKFVFLHDLQGVDQVGARYLLFHRKPLFGLPFPESETCLAKLRALYGEPIDIDERLAVFDLRAPRPGQGAKGRAVQ